MSWTPRIVPSHEYDKMRSLHDRYTRIAYCEKTLALAALRLEHFEWPVEDDLDDCASPAPIRRAISPYVQRLRKRVRASFAHGTVRGEDA